MFQTIFIQFDERQELASSFHHVTAIRIGPARMQNQFLINFAILRLLITTLLNLTYGYLSHWADSGARAPLMRLYINTFQNYILIIVPFYPTFCR